MLRVCVIFLGGLGWQLETAPTTAQSRPTPTETVPSLLNFAPAELGTTPVQNFDAHPIRYPASVPGYRLETVTSNKLPRIPEGLPLVAFKCVATEVGEWDLFDPSIFHESLAMPTRIARPLRSVGSMADEA